jgi:hypothetical protein
MEIRPTYPIFLEDVTVNRHIFLFGLMYDMLASFIGINATVKNISAMMYNMALGLDINNTKTQPAQIHFHLDIVLLCIIIKFIFLKEKSEIYLDMLASFIGINATVDNISAMMYNMALGFIGV